MSMAGGKMVGIAGGINGATKHCLLIWYMTEFAADTNQPGSGILYLITSTISRVLPWCLEKR